MDFVKDQCGFMGASWHGQKAHKGHLFPEKVKIGKHVII